MRARMNWSATCAVFSSALPRCVLHELTCRSILSEGPYGPLRREGEEYQTVVMISGGAFACLTLSLIAQALACPGRCLGCATSSVEPLRWCSASITRPSSRSECTCPSHRPTSLAQMLRLGDPRPITSRVDPERSARGDGPSAARTARRAHLLHAAGEVRRSRIAQR